ncbi:MAG: hypothetical protein JXA71_12280 [Chitinispirillaceae bacterium]|nr:hypothetical protein [Chitinispirillaceae bacterium]
MRHHFIQLLCLGSALVAAAPSVSHARNVDSVTSDGLKFCISYYRDGYYNRTIECINDVLPGLTVGNDSMCAYKYLALSYGMINRIEQAEECFRLALEKDSTMEIDTLEFPPNIALIYKHVKLERKVQQFDSAAPKPAASTTTLQVKKDRTVPALFVTGAVFCAGAGSVAFYNGYRARKEYSSLRPPKNPQSEMDRVWSEFLLSIAGGSVATLVSGICLYFAFSYDPAPQPVALSADNGGIALSIAF